MVACEARPWGSAERSSRSKIVANDISAAPALRARIPSAATSFAHAGTNNFQARSKRLAAQKRSDRMHPISSVSFTMRAISTRGGAGRKRTFAGSLGPIGIEPHGQALALYTTLKGAAFRRLFSARSAIPRQQPTDLAGRSRSAGQPYFRLRLLDVTGVGKEHGLGSGHQETPALPVNPHRYRILGGWVTSSASRR